jgi:hypothetical protein
MALVISKHELPKGDRMPLSPAKEMAKIFDDAGLLGPNGVVWTDQSTTRRCLWQGPHGRCIYELGNHTQHKEEIQRA